MSGYHKSIEVYKFLRKNGVPVIVPIRSLWVSGSHMDVAYIDHNVTIIGFTSSPIELYDYTERTVDVPSDHQFNIIGMSADGDITFIEYTQQVADVPSDHQFNIIGISSEDDITFTPYASTTIDVPSDHQFNILGLTYDGTVDAIDAPIIDANLVPDHMLTISDFTSTSLVIS